MSKPVNFLIRALSFNEFENLFYLTDSQLKDMGAMRLIVDKNPGYPCRVSLKDAGVGEEVLLLPYQHHKTTSPYQASGPIYIRKNAQTAILKKNEIPQMLIHRLLSLRAYDNCGMMLAGVVAEGTNLEEHLFNLFSNTAIEYIHIHNAKPGCFNCIAERVMDKN